MRLAERSGGGPCGPRGGSRGGWGSGGGGFCEDRRAWDGAERGGRQTRSEGQRRGGCLELDGGGVAEGGMEGLPGVDLPAETARGPARPARGPGGTPAGPP